MSEALLAAIADATLWLDERYDLGEFKARDPREPGRREKTKAELALFRDVARLFRKMAKAIRARLDQYPRPVKDFQDPMGDEWWAEQEAALRAILLRHAGKGTTGGARLFEAAIGVGIDQTQVNKQASKWVQSEYTKLSKTITDGVSKELQKQIQAFIETPGTTVGDVMDRLGLETSHAEMIAITEITRAYSKGNELAGQELQREFPDVEVIETWFTNNDEIVCPICLPLNDKTVKFGEAFDEANGIMRPPAHPRCRCWTDVSTNL